MKPKKFQDLGASAGQTIICVSENTSMFTQGCVYEVELMDNGGVAVLCDCGFYCTTSASEFVFVRDGATAVVTEEVSLTESAIILAPTKAAPIVVELAKYASGEVVASIKDALSSTVKDWTVNSQRSRSPPYPELIAA